MRPSAISWTDYSGGDLNFVTGCTPASAGCEHCYARAIYTRFDKPFDQVQTHPDKLERLQRATFLEHSPKRGPGHKPMVFVVDTGDLFHEAVPVEFAAAALGVMARRTDVVWQILTKRADRMQTLCKFLWEERGAPGHIWLGVTAENQETADERIPLLLGTPAAVRWVSAEPMLAPLDLWGARYRNRNGSLTGAVTNWAGCGVDWVVVGGESGPERRPFDLAWAMDLYHQCKAAGTPFFLKQGSALRPGQDDRLPGVGEVKGWPR